MIENCHFLCRTSEFVHIRKMHDWHPPILQVSLSKAQYELNFTSTVSPTSILTCSAYMLLLAYVNTVSV
jgi:hypothetical protein